MLPGWPPGRWLLFDARALLAALVRDVPENTDQIRRASESVCPSAPYEVAPRPACMLNELKLLVDGTPLAALALGSLISERQRCVFDVCRRAA